MISLDINKDDFDRYIVNVATINRKVLYTSAFLYAMIKEQKTCCDMLRSQSKIL